MPCGLCKFGRFRPLADLGLITCILSELGCQVELSPAVLTTVLRSGGAKFTGASMAIASQDPWVKGTWSCGRLPAEIGRAHV